MSDLKQPEIITVSEHRVACDGGGGTLGHPKVYLDMGQEQFRDLQILWTGICVGALGSLSLANICHFQSKDWNRSPSNCWFKSLS